MNLRELHAMLGAMIAEIDEDNPGADGDRRVLIAGRDDGIYRDIDGAYVDDDGDVIVRQANSVIC